jgi:hypothetical protein
MNKIMEGEIMNKVLTINLRFQIKPRIFQLDGKSAGEGKDHKYSGIKNTQDYSVVICNHPYNLHYSCICQRKHHYIQIHPREEWEFGAVLRADRILKS